MNKSKLTVEQHHMVEQLEVLGDSKKKLQEIVDTHKQTSKALESISSAIGGIEIKPVVNVSAPDVPDIKVPPAVVNIPEIKVPTINVPKADAPVVNLDKVAKAVKGLKVDPLPAVSDEGSKLYFNGKPLEPKHARIAAEGTGITEIVPAVEGKQIHIVSCFLMASDATDIELVSGDIEPLSGVIALIPSTGFVLPYNVAGWARTGVGESLGIEQHDNARVGGLLTYVEV